MRRKVRADEVVLDVVYKTDIRQVSIKDWRRVEGLVRWVFVTKCTDNEIEVAMVAEKDIDILRFFVEWEVENRGRDIKIDIGGKEIQFRKCKVCDIDISDFKSYDGDALSITVGMTHSGIIMS